MMLTPAFLSPTKFHRTTFVVVESSNAFADQLHFCIEDAFTGQLDLQIEGDRASPASLYFQKGDLIWGSGGTHPTRRWYRHLFQVFSASAIESFTPKGNQFQQLTYDFLQTLLIQNKIQTKDVDSILKGIVVEILFDLCQQWFYRHHSNLKMKFSYAHSDAIKIA